MGGLLYSMINKGLLVLDFFVEFFFYLGKISLSLNFVQAGKVLGHQFVQLQPNI
jgi:hypothetical protein